MLRGDIVKVYIDSLVFNKDGKERCKYGLSVYDNVGHNIYNACVVRDSASSENKFENLMSAILWGIKRLNMKLQNKKLTADGDTILYIPSKTIYTWFEKETSPIKYIDDFSEILLELGFFSTDIEVTHTAAKKVKFVDDSMASEGLVSSFLADKIKEQEEAERLTEDSVEENVVVVNDNE